MRWVGKASPSVVEQHPVGAFIGHHLQGNLCYISRTDSKFSIIPGTSVPMTWLPEGDQKGDHAVKYLS